MKVGDVEEGERAVIRDVEVRRRLLGKEDMKAQQWEVVEDNQQKQFGLKMLQWNLILC